MSLISVRYDLSLGLQKSVDYAALVAGIALERGELELLGMRVIGDQTTVLSATLLSRQLLLQPLEQGVQSFPSAATLESATQRLYGGTLGLDVPARVINYSPVVEEFTPLDVPNLAYWWRSDMGVTFDFATSAVSAWRDFIQERDFVQATEANRPTHIVFGYNTTLFDGTQWLDVDGDAFDWSFLHDGSGSSIFIAAIPGSAAASQALLSTTTLGSVDAGVNLWFNGATETWNWDVGNGAALVIDTSVASDPNEPRYIAARFLEGRAGNEWAFEVNAVATSGNTAAAPTADPAPAPPRMALSAVSDASPFTGTVPELAFYDAYVSDEDKNRLITYYVQRYGSF